MEVVLEDIEYCRTWLALHQKMRNNMQAKLRLRLQHVRAVKALRKADLAAASARRASAASADAAASQALQTLSSPPPLLVRRHRARMTASSSPIVHKTALVRSHAPLFIAPDELAPDAMVDVVSVDPDDIIVDDVADLDDVEEEEDPTFNPDPDDFEIDPQDFCLQQMKQEPLESLDEIFAYSSDVQCPPNFDAVLNGAAHGSD
jgi:hypothetical protein